MMESVCGDSPTPTWRRPLQYYSWHGARLDPAQCRARRIQPPPRQVWIEFGVVVVFMRKQLQVQRVDLHQWRPLDQH
jgi:hypothetical protein